MQPASDNNDSGGGGFNAKRLAPVAILAVVVLIIVAVVASGGGDDDTDTGDGTTSTTVEGGDGDPDDETTTTDPDGNTDGRPDGPITFSQAEEDGLDVTFSDTCDPETGRIAMPYFFAPECYAEVEDNGGATHNGVTADSIKVVLYNGPDVDPVIDFITAPIANDDTAAQVAETALGYMEMFNAMYETYGRDVDVQVLNASGPANDAVAARADAVKAVEEMGAFAVIGGPALSNAWTDEIAARGVVCVSCPGGSQQFLEDRAPFIYSVTAGGYQNATHLAEYVGKKLGGKPAIHAGDEGFQTTERKIADVYLRSSEESDIGAEDLADRLETAGVTLAEQLNYNLDDVSRLGEQATNIIAKLKDASVTTVIFRGDPVAPGVLTREATAQEYFPEWVLGGSALLDVTAFGRTFDQAQWANAFGISSLTVRTPPTEGASWRLYEWFHGTTPPAPDTNGVIFPGPSLFMTGIQAAGPNLTPESFRDGLFSLQRGTVDAITNPLITYGDQGIWPETDWNGIDNYTELWWDAEATGPDEIRKEGVGMYQYVDGGVRYLPGEWTDELKVFDPDGAVALLDDAPADETPPDYPSPS